MFLKLNTHGVLIEVIQHIHCSLGFVLVIIIKQMKTFDFISTVTWKLNESGNINDNNNNSSDYQIALGLLTTTLLWKCTCNCYTFQGTSNIVTCIHIEGVDQYQQLPSQIMEELVLKYKVPEKKQVSVLL